MQIKINEQLVDVNPGDTILEAARRAGIYIPTLCYHEAFGGKGSCRMCLVEVKDGDRVRTVVSCTYPITHEIKVKTSTPAIEKLRQNIVMLLYKRASGSELMQDLKEKYQCPPNTLAEAPNERCILCRLCVNACELLGSSAISAIMRGTEKEVATPYHEASAACIGCGSCATICPTGAIEMKQQGNTRTIWDKTFTLVNCERCGKPFATREQLDYIAQKTETPQVGSVLCEPCSKKATAEKLKEFNM